MDELPWVLLGIRTAAKEDLGVSVAELVYGGSLTLPGEFMDPDDDVRENTMDLLSQVSPSDPCCPPIGPSSHAKSPSEFQVCLHPPRWSPAPTAAALRRAISPAPGRS